MANFLSNYKNYLDKKILIVCLLGIVQGFPAIFTFGSVASVWFRENGLSMWEIGLFTLITAFYNFKFVWAPFIDNINVPLLTKWLGNRRAWLVVLLPLLALNLLAVGSLDPNTYKSLVIVLMAILAFLSASVDIVADAYRIDILNDDQQNTGASSIVFGWRLGYNIIGYSGLFLLADWLGTDEDPESWFYVFCVGAGFILFMSFMVLLFPAEEKKQILQTKNIHEWLHQSVILPFKEFTKKNGWWQILLFISLFKLGDAFASSLISLFYLDMKFEKTELATLNKGVGLIAAILGVVTFGLLSLKFNLIKLMWISGILMMVSNLVFCVLSEIGRDLNALVAAVFIENYTSGIGTAAFVAFITILCSKRFSATQYALLSSIAVLARTLMNASSGFIQESLGWYNFFLLSTFLAIPGLVCLYIISKKYRSSILSD